MKTPLTKFKNYREKCRNMHFQMFVIDQMAKQLKSNNKDIIYLAVGRSEEETPQNIIASICTALNDVQKSQAVVPLGLPELRESVSEYYSRFSSTPFSGDDVFISSGTSGVYLDLNNRNTVCILCKN